MATLVKTGKVFQILKNKVMKSFKEIIGAKPLYHESDDSYTPSKASLAIMASEKTNYDHTDYPNADTSGTKKVLVICVDQQYLVCKNGKRFKTGNHPVELFLVVMHLEKAGFEPVFATITGGKVHLEYWAMPTADEEVMAFKDKHQHKLDHPEVLSEITEVLNPNTFEAVFVPGGQGAVLGLPDSTDVKRALLWFLKNQKHIIVICHGPAALLSLSVNEDPENFPLKGYELACLPSSGDKMATSIGYLPGEMPWSYDERLEDLGMQVVNKLPVGITHKDLKLLSGDSPLAANKLGKMAAETLLESINATV